MNFMIVSDKQLILEHYSGSISIKDLINNKIQISRANGYNPNFNIILDFRETQFSINEEEGLQFLNFLKNSKDIFAKRFVAYLTDTPQQVATTDLFNGLLSNSIIRAKTFSTPEAAFKWINLPEKDYALIMEYLNTMRNK